MGQSKVFRSWTESSLDVEVRKVLQERKADFRVREGFHGRVSVIPLVPKQRLN